MIATAIFIALFACIIFYLLGRNNKNDAGMSKSKIIELKRKPTPEKVDKHEKSNVVYSKHASKVNSNGTDLMDHKYFWKEVGGHTSRVTCLAFSANGSLVGSCSSDGSIRCIALSDVGLVAPKEIYTKIDLSPSAICFTQNSKRLIVAIENKLNFYAFQFSQDSKKFEYVKSLNTNLKNISSVCAMDIEHWMVVVVCGVSSSDEPCVQVFDQKGTSLNTLAQTKRKGKVDKNRPALSKKAIAVASQDDHFIAIYGVGEDVGVGDGDVGVFEVSRRQDGTATGLKLSFVLSGHISDVIGFAWSPTGTNAVSLCQNGSWRLWDTSTRYDDQDRPRLYTGQLTLPNGITPSHVCLLSGNVLVFSDKCDLYFCQATSGTIVYYINNACKDVILAIKANNCGELFATVVNNTRRIPVWKYVK